MKKTLVALFVVCVGLVSSKASAQTMFQVGSPRDSAGTGTAYVQPIYVINDTCAVGMADSSAVYKFGDYSGAGVWIKCESPGAVRLAVQIRAHALPASSTALRDSENVAVWFPSENSSIVSTGATDSLSYGYFRLADSATQGNGEVLVRWAHPISGASKWGVGGGGIYLYFPVRTPFISVRVRVLSATANTPRVKVMMAGLKN